MSSFIWSAIKIPDSIKKVISVAHYVLFSTDFGITLTNTSITNIASAATKMQNTVNAI